MFIPFLFFFFFKDFSGLCSSVNWALACKAKGCWFDSQLGYMPGFRARYPGAGGGVPGYTRDNHTLMFLSLSFSLPHPLSKKNNNFLKDFIYLLLERGWEGEKHQYVVASHVPSTGNLAQPRHVPWLGIELVTPWSAGWRSVHWTTPARAPIFILINSALMSHYPLEVNS